MNATQALRGAERVADWPRISATVRADGTGTITINGTGRTCAAAGVNELRTGMIARCVAIANRLHRPVRVTVTDVAQTWTLAVRPEGIVQAVSDAGLIPPADGLSVHEGRCRRCRRLQAVTSTTCPQCGVDEPHRVEADPIAAEAIVPDASAVDELDLTRTYLGIMQKRFAHQFEVEYDLDDAAMECLIPKLSLQPLVENALLHGILYCEKPEKRLVIRAWRSSRAFGVEIEDNGSGMTPETAQRLTELDIHTSKSYGVANVHKRLDIFGQGKCKFYISSREGVGTCVMIELPVQTQNNH